MKTPLLERNKASFEKALVALCRTAANEKEELVRMAIANYAESALPFFLPEFHEMDRSNRDHRLADQIVGGFPFTSTKWPWPSNNGPAQFVCQVNLGLARRLLNHDFGDGLLQVFADHYDACDEFTVRTIPTADLSEPLSDDYPPEMDRFNEEGMLSIQGIGAPTPRMSWVPAGDMFLNGVTDAIPEELRALRNPRRRRLLDRVFEIDEEMWDSDYPYSGNTDLLGDPMNSMFLGGYAFGDGNGWNLHKPAERVLLNLWSDGGALWHLAVSSSAPGNFSIGVSCTR